MAKDAPPGLAGEDRLRREPRPGTEDKRLLASADQAFAPPSYDREAGTVDIVWSTGAAVRRYDWWDDEYYDEELDLAGADLARLRAGAPLLMDHWASIDRLVGSVVPDSVRLDKGKGTATLRFDRTSEEGQKVEAKVAAGHLRHVSIGYRVEKWEVIREAGKVTRWIARQWSPHEISFVPVPADAGAGTRGLRAADPAPTNNPSTKGPAMDPDKEDAARKAEQEAKDKAAAEAKREAEIEAARKAERERVREIEDRCEKLKLPKEFARTLVDEGVSVEKAASRIVDELARVAEKPPVGPRVELGRDHTDPAEIRAAMAEAVASEISRSFKPENKRHVEFRGLRPTEMVRILFEARGERNLPRNPRDFAARAFHTSSDFPLLLEAAANKALLADYALAMPTFKQFMGQKTFNDFKAHKFLRVGDFPSLAALSEAGEITLGTISEGRESLTLATYAKGITVTRQVFVNDDLGAFAEFSGMIGRRLADFENTTAFAQVTTASGAGPNLADGNAVFTTGRDNKASSGAAIDLTTLSTARQKLRSRTSLDGLKLNLSPRFLLTGPAYETIAWQYSSAQFTPATAGNANPFMGVYTPIVDANITGNNWYLLADPAAAPVYVYGYLRGAEGPQTRSYEMPGTDGGMRFDVWLDFACGPIDWRGGWMNPGA